jgi:hypothetical protein
LEADVRPHFAKHFARAEIAGEKNKRLLELHDRIVAHTQAPLVENAQQQRIQRRRGLFDLIEQDDRDIALLTDNAQQPFLCQQRLCLTVADISRRRADQLSDFMVRLVLGAVDPEKLLLAAMEDFGKCLDCAGLTSAGWTKKQKDARGAIRRAEAGLIHLDIGNDVLQGAGLADDFPQQQFDEITEGRVSSFRP